MKSTISIPSPCSEDWNKMTPTDKGAFCGKCQFEVVDFTGKDPDQIKQILRDRAGSRTCGHIAPVQMEMVNTNYHVWENQPFKVFRSKFLYACLIVFGFTLFTGCSSNDEREVNVMGGMEDVGIVVDTSASCNALDTGLVIDGEMEILEGDIQFEDGEIEMIEE